MILAKNYIKTGFSVEDADKLDVAIASEITQDSIVIDFEGVKFFTTLFFNNALAKYVLKLGPENYESKFKIRNLSDIGKTTYDHSLENAKEYYKLPPEKREVQDEILSSNEE